jgi:hypothetical protein
MTNKTHVIYSLISPVIMVITIALIGSSIHTENTKKQAYTDAISYSIEGKTIDRKTVLEKFFAKYKSPLKDNIDTFITVADKYNIDYRLLPAISCIESSCGKKLIPGSYNPFGWGIYGNNVITFNNYDEAIETVGQGLNKHYFSKGLDTPEKIAPVYTPPAYVHWSRSVRFFMNQMGDIQSEDIS